eukprot:562295-Rhodomonas_salina.2
MPGSGMTWTRTRTHAPRLMSAPGAPIAMLALATHCKAVCCSLMAVARSKLADEEMVACRQVRFPCGHSALCQVRPALREGGVCCQVPGAHSEAACGVPGVLLAVHETPARQVPALPAELEPGTDASTPRCFSSATRAPSPPTTSHRKTPSFARWRSEEGRAEEDGMEEGGQAGITGEGRCEEAEEITIF